MTATAVLESIEAAGIKLTIDGGDLMLEAPTMPSSALIEEIKCNKQQILALLRPAPESWSAEDWRSFFNERAGIAEHDGRLSRAEAEAAAFEACTTEWMTQNHPSSPADRCAWCERDDDGPPVLPFGTFRHGHLWLHAKCWPSWRLRWQREATAALRALGLSATVG